ncbi:MAG: nitroreductase, partial [Pseudomonadota bacterium]
MLDTADLRSFVAQAVLAPSSHNTQPWLFQIQPNSIRVLADRLRVLPVNDPFDRELTISCGCAIMTFRVAAAAAGFGCTVTLQRDPEDPDVMADVTFDGPVEHALAELVPAIPKRHTNRGPVTPAALPSGLIRDLVEAVEAEGAQLHVLEDEALRTQVSALVAQGDALQWSNPSWRAELAQWMHPRSTGDGLSMLRLAAPIARWVVRLFDLGKSLAKKDRDLAKNAPLLAVLSTDQDTVDDWLTGGQALQRCLLKAAQAGVQVGYLNQPVEV